MHIQLMHKPKPSIPERRRLESIYDRYRHSYQETLNKLYRRVRKILTKTDVNFNIKYRVKSFDSYFDKLRRMRQDGEDFALINDVLGMRVVLPFLEDVQLVQKLITEHFDIVEIEYKGAKNSFREFSYDSIHILIDISKNHSENTIPYMRKVCEIQIRSTLQDAWAEVEHELIYKATSILPNDSIKRKLASLNASLTLSDIIFQEIRDYQKGIAQWRERRHESFLEKVQSDSPIILTHSMDTPTLEEKEKIAIEPLKPKSQLEKDIFEALEAHSAQKYKQAISIYSRILRNKMEPRIRTIIYNHRGMAYFVQSKYEKSLKDFDKAIEFDPQNTNGYNHRGMTYRILNEYENALADFEYSLELNPYQHETHHMRALTYHDINDFSNALENCQRTIDLKPDFQPAKHLKKLITSKMGY